MTIGYVDDKEVLIGMQNCLHVIRYRQLNFVS